MEIKTYEHARNLDVIMFFTIASVNHALLSTTSWIISVYLWYWSIYTSVYKFMFSTKLNTREWSGFENFLSLSKLTTSLLSFSKKLFTFKICTAEDKLIILFTVEAVKVGNMCESLILSNCHKTIIITKTISHYLQVIGVCLNLAHITMVYLIFEYNSFVYSSAINFN